MLVGYMRVSTDGDRQVMDLQRDALLAAGVDERHLFEDRASGSRGDRAGLVKALAFLRAGDCLVVWKLDRLGRSLPHLLTRRRFRKKDVSTSSTGTAMALAVVIDQAKTCQEKANFRQAGPMTGSSGISRA